VRRLLAAAALTAALFSKASAQSSVLAEPGSQLTIYLLTMGPGDQVWEKFGHNAIWIHDELTHTDSAYHWGLFDFADKDFVPRFIQGRMRYAMGSFGFDETIDAYRRTNRTVWAQRLNLSPAERQRLQDFVKWNVLPENRYYRYDYFRDNCSTRVRDALDRALGGSIQRASAGVGSNTTYRFHTSRLTQDDWPVFTGTMMGLGQPTDRRIDAWEEMFLPVRMMDRFRSIRISTATGSQPLVQQEMVLVQSTRAPEDSTVRRGMLGYLLIASVLLALGIALWFFGLRRGAVALALLWSFVAGLGGTLLAGLWGFTDHLYSYRNENLFQLNPLSLVVAVTLIGLLWRLRGGRANRPSSLALGAAVLVAALSVAGFVIQIVPAFYQVNADVIALALPLHLGVAMLLVALARKPTMPSTNS
jgi:hypothetical protein